MNNRLETLMESLLRKLDEAIGPSGHVHRATLRGIHAFYSSMYDGLPKPPACVCDEAGDSDCEVHLRENQLQELLISAVECLRTIQREGDELGFTAQEWLENYPPKCSDREAGIQRTHAADTMSVDAPAKKGSR